jgi:hypothetical protein
VTCGRSPRTADGKDPERPLCVSDCETCGDPVCELCAPDHAALCEKFHRSLSFPLGKL